MPTGGYDIRALARTINRRREEYNRRHPDGPLPITPAMSRILENDEEYVPYRTRSERKQRPPVSNPGVFTIAEIATALGTTVGDLLGEPAYRVTLNERRRLRDFVRWLTSLFDLDAPELDEPPRRR
jgi:hypothetical protein